MIIFKSLSYKNFRSTGNEFTKIDFLRSPSTLVIGKNGSAKSNIIWALYFCLYGKTFDSSVNKPQLLNRIVNKELLTEVEFSISEVEYKVIRGIKPNIFEIYKNGELIPQNSDIKDYQYKLEKEILKIDSKSFLQIVVLGKTDYRPFMKLTALERRTIVEDLLDIQIFSSMNIILKGKIDESKKILSEYNNAISILEVKIEAEKKNIENIKSNTDSIVNIKKEYIIDTEKEIKVIEIKIKEYKKELEVHQDNVENLLDIENKVKKLSDYNTQFNSKKNELLQENRFYDNNQHCPTCKQEISIDFKNSKIEKNNSKKVEYEQALSKVNEQLNDNRLLLTKIKEKLNIISNINNNISDLSRENNSKNNYIKTLNNEINDIISNNSLLKQNNNDIDKLRLDLDKEICNKNKLVDEVNIMNVSALLLKDSGIKTNVIRQYIPIINQSINKYLECLDLYINFELDDKFNETIKSSGMDILTYGCFSEGEKQKIDLALTFAWRDIAKKRNSASCNLLIMDEVLDGSLDSDSSIDLLQILDTFSNDTNIFVISHRPDLYYDKFRNIISFKKTKNFSKIVEN